MSYRVTTPVKGFTGEVVGAVFQDGSATVDGDVSYFERHGYHVEAVDDSPKGNASGETERKPKTTRGRTVNAGNSRRKV